MFRLATTLVRHGFLAKDPETRRYRVGLRAFEVGNEHRCALPRLPVPALTPRTVRSLSALGQALTDVRERGFGFYDEESVVGLQAIAAAVRGPDRAAVAAVSIAYPKRLVASTQIAKLAGLVRESAGAISERLGAAVGDERAAELTRRRGSADGKGPRPRGLTDR